jgi:hypothetical protein
MNDAVQELIDLIRLWKAKERAMSLIHSNKNVLDVQVHQLIDLAMKCHQDLDSYVASLSKKYNV